MSSQPPLLLIPGLNCTRALWTHQIAALSSRIDIQVPDVTTHDNLGDLANAILAAAPDRFALGGLSMGGYVALETMRRAPERVTRLALIDTQARADTDEARDRRLSLIALAEAGEFDKVIDLLFGRLVAATRLNDKDLEAVVRGMAVATGVEGFVRQQRLIMARPDARPGLALIRCPTIVIVGDDDRITPQSLAEEMASAIRNARLAVIAGAGHLSPLEAPEAVTAHLQAWLQQ